MFLDRDTPGPQPKKPPRKAIATPAPESARLLLLVKRLTPARTSAVTTALAAMLLANPAAAQEVDPCAQPPASNATPAQAQRHFEALEPQCLRNPAHYRQRGQWLLKQSNPGAAMEVLERALLLEPEHLGTQLDYAQALIVTGELDTAAALLSALQAQPNVPAPIAALLASQLQALEQVKASQLAAATVSQGLTGRVVFSQSLGGDTNLNNAPSASSILLTYPELDLNLPLQDASQAQSGATAATALQWSGLLPVQRQLWVLQAKTQARQTSTATNRYQQAEFGATWLQNPSAPQQWIARAEHTQLRWDNKKLYSSHKLSLQHQWVPAFNTANTATNCRLAVGAEVEDRAFATSRAADGLYRGATLALVCQNSSSLSVQLSTGRDQPQQPERVGGAQHQHELRVQWQFAALGNQWQTEYTHQRQQDTTGYSPLLARNAVRRVSRQALRLEVSRPTNWATLGSPQWFGSLEFARQTSNLALFASSRNAAQTGLRWSWP